MFEKIDIDRAFSMVKPPVESAVCASNKVESRIQNEDYGYCPYCNGKMREVFAYGNHVLLCDQDRAVMPVRDDLIKPESEHVGVPAPLDLNFLGNYGF